MKSNRSNSSAKKLNHFDNTKRENTNSDKDFQAQTESTKNILHTPNKPSDKSSAKNDLSWKNIFLNQLLSIIFTLIGMTSVYLIMSHQKNTIISQHTQQNHELMNHIRTLQTQECPANTTSKIKWTYFSQPKILAEYDCTSLQQFVFNYKNIIPEDKNIIQVKMVIFSRTYQQHHGDYWLRVRSLNGKDQFQHYLFMRTLPRDVVTSQADTMFIPSDKTRQVRVKSNRVRLTSNPIQLILIGYSYQERI